jgi:alpha-galactosidase
MISGRLVAAQTGSGPAPLKGEVDPVHGSYSLKTADGRASLSAITIAAQVDGNWLHANDFGKPAIARSIAAGVLGDADCRTVTYAGGLDKPDLTYRLCTDADRPFADIQVSVHNSTSRAITVQDIRALEASANSLELGGPQVADRILSDSFSEDRPEMKIRDLADAANQMYRGVGSQLLFNRESGRSFFVGALTSDKFLTILRVHLAATGSPAIESFEADSTGTTELTREFSLEKAPPEDQIELSVTVQPGHSLDSERLLLSLDSDPHRQLDMYGRLIPDLHHARVSAPTPMGWWSWTAYYAKLDQANALANARWLARNLKPLGYNFFHVDEGYSAARGDYLAPNPKTFPGGMEKFEKQIAALGLTPAIWTAPFEVSERSWVYKNHPDWMVKDSAGKPLALAGVVMPEHDRIYVLDVTNPGAQQYLTTTYSTMTKQWGIRYIKLDFMEDTSIEGVRYAPETSALEAQRIGLRVIRAAVGDRVYLDKDGSEMLNPVGIVDMGRISQDTGHNFKALKASATGFAARYYMNRNWFIADPDAFMVTKGEGENSLTLDEARVSIALSAVTGGMFEIGNPLPDLDAQPERLALIRNKELIAMARAGVASMPIDLMSYLPEDTQPSIFNLRKSNAERILTIFNWTENEREHEIAADALGLKLDSTYKIVDILTGKEIETCHKCVLHIKQPAHSVRMLKIVEQTN